MTASLPEIGVTILPDGAEDWSIPPATVRAFGGDIERILFEARRHPERFAWRKLPPGAVSVSPT